MMMDNFVLGNMAWNAGIVAVAGFFIKRWIDKTDMATNNLASSQNIASNTSRQEIRDALDEMSGKLEKVYIEIRLANGRTAKIENKIEIQMALCDERHPGHHKLTHTGGAG